MPQKPFARRFTSDGPDRSTGSDAEAPSTGSSVQGFASADLCGSVRGRSVSDTQTVGQGNLGTVRNVTGVTTDSNRDVQLLNF